MKYPGDSESRESILDMICLFLERAVAQSQQMQDDYDVTPFDAVKPPNISVTRYFKDRIVKYSNCSIEALVMSLIYMDRIVRSAHDSSPTTITPTNVHRLLICSAMLAAKFFDDEYYDNAYFARVGGISTQELNNLELHFLSCINFGLFVSTTEYKNCFVGLRSMYNHGMPAGVPATISVPVPVPVPVAVSQPIQVPTSMATRFPMDMMEMDGVRSRQGSSPQMEQFITSVY